MGVLVRNHYIDPDPIPEYDSESLFGSVTAVERWQDVEEYMIILQKGKRVGASLTEIRQVGDPSTTLTFTADFRLVVQLSPVLPKLTVKGNSLLNRHFELDSFHATAEIGPASFSATGLAANNLLYLKTRKPNGISKKRIELNYPISLVEAIRPAIGSKLVIESGKSFKTPVIDPLTGQNRGTLTISIKDKERITVGGKPMQAYRVISEIHDVQTVMWVDDNGRTLKRQLVGDFAMERATRDEVLKQAPLLAEGIEIPEINVDEFQDVPIEKNAVEDQGTGNSGMQVLRSLL